MKIIDSCIFCKKLLGFFKFKPHILCKECNNKLIYFNEENKDPLCFFIEDIKVFSLFVYCDISSVPLIKLKYNYSPFLSKDMVKLMIKNIKINWGDYDYLIPIPMKMKKRIVRGYNQSELIAIEISKVRRQKIPVLYCLSKIDESSQKNKNLEERISGVETKFSVQIDKIKEGFRRKRAIIVDDTVITGATILSAYLVLRPFFHEIVVVSFAASKKFLGKEDF